MNMNSNLFTFIVSSGLLMAGEGELSAAEVSVEMNAVSATMKLTRIADGESVETGAPASRIYRFETEPGEYLLTGYATNGTTVNGSIKITVEDTEEVQAFKILTCTVYATNKKADGSTWMAGTDFTLDLSLTDKNGKVVETTPGDSSTAGRMTFLALNGNSYFASIEPSEEWQEEGYLALTKGGTITFNTNINGAVPMGGDYQISVPEDAELFLGIKTTHFIQFREILPTEVAVENGIKLYSYRLANAQVYNFRTWMKGGLTHAGYFTMNTDPEKCPQISFMEEDYSVMPPTQINHSVDADSGYETGDIFVNINPQGYLRMNVGDTFDAHAMRSWELTDSATGNYFMEPDFHYTVINPDGTPGTGVIEIDNADTGINPWSTIRAVGEGTAIVLVRYDGIGVNYYSGTTQKEFMGGDLWGASWPENTAVYVVSVGLPESSVDPDMLINKDYVNSASKLSGDKIDSENDVIYYIAGEEGAKYSFTPSNAASVELARPIIDENTMTFNGFRTEGVEKDENGEYTLTLPEGRNIVRLCDPEGNATYQVITVKECELAVTNETDPERTFFIPGDKVTLQFSGLRHPANKLAGIYNMSANIVYNVTPENKAYSSAKNQYKYASTPTAQAITFTIPESYDADENPEWIMSAGSLQISGFGDPIGSHRDISPIVGRSANFTAIAHNTCLGSLPDIKLPVKKDIVSGLDSFEKEKTIVTILSIDGIRRTEISDGINIVVYSDGSTAKILK